MLDLATIRSRFPALAREIDGRPVIHADNPGGTQVPASVAEAMSTYLLHRNANVHGTFETSRLTDETVDGARQAMADLLNAGSPAEIVFGNNMTSLTFMLRHILARMWEPEDEVVVTQLDHDANYTPWLMLSEVGAVVQEVSIRTSDATLDLEAFEKALSPRTKLVAVGHASNAVGTINPLERIVPLVRERAPDAVIFVDAVQSVPHLPVDVQALGVDVLVCSAYKFFGPHVGVMWGREEFLEGLPAYKVRAAPAEVPDRFEQGTKNHEGLAGVTAAVDYLASLAPGETRRERLRRAMESIRDYEQELSAHLISGLREIPALTFYGIDDVERVEERVPTVAVTLEGWTPYELALALGGDGIFCWSGHYYALNAIEALGLAPHGALRLGLTHYNTLDEVSRVVEALTRLQR